MDFEPFGKVTGLPDTALQDILVMAKLSNGTPLFAFAEKVSVAVAVAHLASVAVHTHVVDQIIVSSYFPVTVPLVPSHADDMSFKFPFHAPEQR
jgi:hypothetical protein